jgi:hypothetical protein
MSLHTRAHLTTRGHTSNATSLGGCFETFPARKTLRSNLHGYSDICHGVRPPTERSFQI